MNCQLTLPDSLEQEQAFLDQVYHTYNVCDSPTEGAMRGLLMKTFRPYIRKEGTIALELGCSDGLMTSMIAEQVDALDVVDGSRNFICQAKQRPLPNVHFIYSLFEEMELQNRYDYIFGCYILEHVIDPLTVLKRIRSVLKPDGLLFIVVPNARALSRQLAVHMGLLSDLKELTRNDLQHGHRRVYERTSLTRDLERAGFERVHEGGLLLKILADFQMDKLLQDRVLNGNHMQGLYRLGLEFPDLCGSLFSICRIKQ